METVMGGNSLELGPMNGATDCENMDTIRLRWGSKSPWGESSTAKSRITCDNINGNTTLSDSKNRVPRSLPWRESFGREGERGFNLTKSDLCPSFVEDLTAKGVSLRVADSHAGNHREDGFTPLETIRFLGIIKSRSHSSSKGGGFKLEGSVSYQPPKEGDGAWHIRIELIDLDEEKFDRAFQSIPKTRKLSTKANPSDILNLDHFHDSQTCDSKFS
ncbi:hypothetical protein Tco_0538407 [Tanacetum coccineum]